MTIKKERASTLQARFGFVDEDLKSDSHDEMMLWLDANMGSIVGDILGDIGFSESRVKRLRKEVSEKFDEFITELKNRCKYIEVSLSMPPSNIHTVILGNEKDREEREDILSFLSSWVEPVMPTIPNREEPVVEKVWEYPIVNKNYTIGFVDMRVAVTYPQLAVDFGSAYNGGRFIYDHWVKGFTDRFPKWETEFSGRHIYFEVKSKAEKRSLGELIRQIRMYQTYCQGKFFIVSEEDAHVAILNEQGIGFVKYPTGNVFQ